MPGEQTHQEVLTLTKRGDQVVCTNEGTSPQGGAGNTTYAFLRSSVVAALGTALAWDQLGCAAGVANHVVFEPDCRDPERRPLAGRLLRAPQHVRHPRPRVARHEQDAAQRPGGSARARLRRRRPVACRSATSSSGCDEHGSLVATPGLGRPGAARRLHRGVPVPGRDRLRRLVVARRLLGGQRRDGRGDGHLRSSSSARRTPTAAAPGCGEAGTASSSAGRRTRSFMTMAAMTFIDPSTNPVAGLGRRLLRPRRQLPARSATARVGELLRDGQAAGEPRGDRGAGRPARTAALRRRARRPCRRATASSSSSTAPAATATRSRATRERVRARRRRAAR